MPDLHPKTVETRTRRSGDRPAAPDGAVPDGLAR
jgi:hypothetical protein